MRSRHGDDDVRALLQGALEDRSCAWSIGTLGAIAEFRRLDDDERLATAPGALTLATRRGALRVDAHEKILPVAYQALSAHPGSAGWTQAVAFCLPRSSALGSRRNTLTEVGRDADAIMARDREQVLFDLGLAVAHLDALVRTADPELLRVLRAQCGASLLEPGNPALAAIKSSSPTRVFVSRLGRIEVFQPIGSRARRIPTPQGPHTHVLPKLLAKRRTHTSQVPIPPGHFPCLELYPPMPVATPARDCAERCGIGGFDALLERYGVAEFVTEKARARAAIRNAVEPRDCPRPTSRLGRAAWRVAIRELSSVGHESATLEAWRERYDPRRR